MKSVVKNTLVNCFLAVALGSLTFSGHCDASCTSDFLDIKKDIKKMIYSRKKGDNREDGSYVYNISDTDPDFDVSNILRAPNGQWYIVPRMLP